MNQMQRNKQQEPLRKTVGNSDSKRYMYFPEAVSNVTWGRAGGTSTEVRQSSLCYKDRNVFLYLNDFKNLGN